MGLFKKDYFKDIEKDRKDWPIDKLYKWYIKLPKHYQAEWSAFYGTVGQCEALHNKYGILFGLTRSCLLVPVDSPEDAKRKGVKIVW